MDKSFISGKAMEEEPSEGREDEWKRSGTSEKDPPQDILDEKT
jgi:hypothetical protein